jgi:hypothetical protein
MITKSEFADWRKADITQEFYKQVLEKVNDYALEIIDKEVPNHEREQLLRGRIQGLYAALKWEPEVEEEATEVDLEQEDEV